MIRLTAIIHIVLSIFLVACEGGKDNPADGGEYESLPTKPGEWRAEDQTEE